MSNKVIDCQEVKVISRPKKEHTMSQVGEAARQALQECTRKGIFKRDWQCSKADFNKFEDVCTYIAGGDSPDVACKKCDISIDAFFVFKYQNKDNKEVQDLFDEAFKSKGGVFIGRCEEVVNGLLEGKINSRTAEVALNGLFKLAAIADKKYSDSPRVEIDARSVNVTQLDADKVLALNDLITGKK